MYKRLEEDLQEIVSDYLEAWKSAYSRVGDLDMVEREELLSLLQDELGILIDDDEFVRLVNKAGLEFDDIVDVFEEGRPLQ